MGDATRNEDGSGDSSEVRTYVIGLGANLGSRVAFLRAAVSRLRASGLAVTSRSPVYLTEPVGPPQPEYVNAAVRIESELTPHEVLDRTQRIERELGRERLVRWGPRTIDLDLLWYDGPPVQSGVLTLPHPRLEERPFALAPLLDVAPEAAPLASALEAAGGRPPRQTDWMDRPTEAELRHDAAEADRLVAQLRRSTARALDDAPPAERVVHVGEGCWDTGSVEAEVRGQVARGFGVREILLSGFPRGDLRLVGGHVAAGSP